MTVERWTSRYTSGDIDHPVREDAPAPARPAVGSAPNPGQYTTKLAVGERTERRPTGESTALVRVTAPVSAPVFVEAPEVVSPWPDVDPHTGIPQLIDRFNLEVAGLLRELVDWRQARFAQLDAARWGPRQLPAGPTS